jgi:excisionase family DNA binding protein
MPARRPDRNPLALPQLLDMPALAAQLATTERHVRRLVSEHRIPFVRVGRFIRFDPSQVAAWLEERAEV